MSKINKKQFKICISKKRIMCGETKPIDQFVKNENFCLDCKKKYNKQYNEANSEAFKEKRKISYKNNKNKINNTSKKYRSEHKEEVKAYNKQYRMDNKIEIALKEKEYKQKNKDKINNTSKKYKAKKRRNNLVFRIQNNVSCEIRNSLRANNVIKHGSKSSWIYLNFTPQQLWEHLLNHQQKQEWMNIHNYGTYNSKTWDDNNHLTWTWNIDHIIPQSDLPYTSMEDENFKTSWSLDNLRPLSAKQNLLDGIFRTRHKRKK